MDLTQLQYFQILAREENMSRAAEKLHVAQPAISASMSRLEKELDARLFDRKGRKIVLNPPERFFWILQTGCWGIWNRPGAC